MTRIRIHARDILAGDTVHSWFGTKTVERIDPYVGPHTFAIGVARFTDGTSMTITTGATPIEVTR